MKETGLILGIESSCDETAAAVVRRGREALSNVVASQMALHANYGGVVPELASREHLRNIVPVVREALTRANLTFADLDAIAVTSGPGLAGALLVGITYAKALAFGRSPLIAVNHLEGHIHAVLMEARVHAAAPIDLPLLALVVSGGHPHLYLAQHTEIPTEQGSDPGQNTWQYKNIGRTRRRRRRRSLRQSSQAPRPRLPRRPLDRHPRSPRKPPRRPLPLRPDQVAHYQPTTSNQQPATVLRLLLQRH